MSSLRDLLLNDDDGPDVLGELSRTFDLDRDRTRSAVEELIPALSRGMKRNADDGQGMDQLLEALRTGEHARYIDQPGTLGTETNRRDGDGILSHVFGDKGTSREVARRAAEKTGLSGAVLQKMLPVLASVAMGMLGKKVLGAGHGAAAPASRAESGGLLGSLLDGDGDGAVWDDVLGMAARGLLR